MSTGAERGRRASPVAELARLGLSEQTAVPELVAAGLWERGEDGQGGPTREDLWPLLRELSEATAPIDALRVVCRLATSQPVLFEQVLADEGWRRRVIAVGGTSPPLGELIARWPDAVESLRTVWPVDAVETADRVHRLLQGRGTPEDQAAAIASARRRATADIASRDLTDVITVDQVASELAELAEGVLSGTLRYLHGRIGGQRPAARLAIIGMGKLGGHELNYISDVDVIFVHEAVEEGSDAEDAARREAAEVFGALLALLNASTTMGRAYEVDPTLRPEGRQGALSRTPASYVAYWQRWAKTWEFQALIKARLVAGEAELGRDLLRRAEPFLWPDELDPGVVQEVRDMKRRVEAKPEVTLHGERQVKLGPGGLRDIEFAVQLLQLVHGRADRRLRVPGTLKALDALARGGYVDEEDASTFGLAYRELRTIEHRLQLARERRTHTIPDDEERQEWLARSLGYRPNGGETARGPFLRHLRTLQGDVRQLHAKLFYRPLLEVHAQVPVGDAGIALAGAPRGLGEAAAATRLEALGFADSRGALRDVRHLTGGVSRRATTLRVVLPAMLHALAESPDPDGGLKALRTVIDSHGRDSRLVSHLRDHPPAADLLARVLGVSPVVGDLLTAVPAAADWLVEDEQLREERHGRDDLVQNAVRQLSWHADLDARTAALRRFKRRELLRIALRDVAGVAPVSVTGEELTGLGEAALESGLRAVLEHLLAGQDPPARFAIVGLGKLGGGELHYCSDLDVLFVHEPAAGVDAADASAFAQQVAELILKTVGAITAEGTAFEVDADLRPEGRSGPLSRSLASYAGYYQRWSEPWEHQALLRARFVAGDADLGHDLVALTRDRAYPDDLGDAGAAAMRKMKARIERERLPRRADPKRHLKLGPGGLTDVEWTVQLLQQRHGRHVAALRTPSTMEALDGFQDVGLLETRDAQWLRDGYRLLWRIRNRLWLMGERRVDELPGSVAVTERLARSLGYGRGGRQDLEEDYLRATRRVRRVVERVFYEAAD